MAVCCSRDTTHAKRFNYYYLDDYRVGENSPSLRAISTRLYARGNLACENTQESFLAAVRSVVIPPTTVLFAYTEGHADIRLPFINFGVGNCVSRRDPTM